MLTLVIGGARSGKSRFAMSLCSKQANVTFIATAHSSDVEMQSRIARHRRERPASWNTIEQPSSLAKAATCHAAVSDVVLIDCLTLWLGQLCWERRNASFDEIESIARTEIEALAIAAKNGRLILVTNEVGCGVVPPSVVGRVFQDLQGFANQAAAREADFVYHVVAGIPTLLKPNTKPMEDLS